MERHDKVTEKDQRINTVSERCGNKKFPSRTTLSGAREAADREAGRCPVLCCVVCDLQFRLVEIFSPKLH